MQALQFRLPETNLGENTITTGIKAGFISAFRPDVSSIMARIDGIVPSLTPKGKAMLTKIEDFALLESNWDSYGAEPPAKLIIERAKSFVKTADKKRLPLYFTAPGPNGEIVVEFNDRKGRSVEVFFNEDNVVEALFYSQDKLINEISDVSCEDVLTFFN